MKLVVVSATLDKRASFKYWNSWSKLAQDPNLEIVFVEGVMGVVPAFLEGLKQVAAEAHVDFATGGPDADEIIVACFHDDLKIYEYAWDTQVLKLFNDKPKIGLAGFGGASGIGDADIYKKPYEPWQLARVGFISNMRDAEEHGSRVTEIRQVAAFDGFCQIGKLSNMLKWYQEMSDGGLIFHAYDTILGAMSYRDNLEAWYLPIACNHAGGMTAIGNQDYQAWAKTQNPDGDKGFWDFSHRWFYDNFRNVLPIRIT